MGAGSAFLVVGPESSGTRLVTRILIAGGATGSSHHSQDFDGGVPAGHDFVVWRRSLPHGGRWPDLEQMIEHLKDAGYGVTVVVCSRDWGACSRSQVKRGHRKTWFEAMTSIQVATRLIYAAINKTKEPHLEVSFDSLVQYPEKIQRWIWGLLGLPGGDHIPVFDANKKHFE